MFSKSLRFLASLSVLACGAVPASAGTIELACTAQCHARTIGAQSGEHNYLEDAHKATVYWCETQTRHEYASVAGGVWCTPPSCPAGTIDAGIVVKNCRGVQKSRYNDDGSPNIYTASEGGCNYNLDSALPPNERFISCDLECQRTRQCVTAAS